MWYLILGLIFLGVISAVLGYFRNSKFQRMFRNGDIDKIPEATEANAENCNGLCGSDCQLSSVCTKIEYYDDEELDRYKGIESSGYEDAEVEEFREVLYTMRAEEVSGWLRSLQMRNINLPDDLKSEAYLLMSDSFSVKQDIKTNQA